MRHQLSTRQKSVIGGLTASVVVMAGLGAAWWMAWPVAVYLAILLGILVVVVGVLAVALWRSSRQTDDLRRASAQDERHAADQQQAEIEDLDRALHGAFRAIDTAAQGGTPGAETLPRMLVLGPTGSGKSSMMAASGLNFPLRTEKAFFGRSSPSASGTRHCDVWCSSDALFFDTTGRYVSDPDAEAEWLHLLKRLDASGGDRPVDGVIVCVSLPAILETGRPGIEHLAARIRCRVQQVVDRLEVRPPIHLVFTQCDGLKGFRAFFDDLTQAHRDAVWGHTFTHPSTADDPGDALPNLDAQLDAAYDRLVDRLRSRRTWVLSRPMSPSRRARVYRFPGAFAEAKTSVQHLMQSLFCRNPYQETPLWRGFYFASSQSPGMESGQDVDEAGPLFTGDDVQKRGDGSRMTEAIDGRRASGTEGLHTVQSTETTLPDAPYLFADSPRPSTGDFEEDGPLRFSGRSMFLKAFFEDVVLEGASVCRPTTRARRRAWICRSAAVALSVVGVGAFCIGALGALKEGQSELSTLRSSAREVQETKWMSRMQTVPEARTASLAALQKLHGQVADLREYDRRPLIPRWGLKRGGVVVDIARDVHLKAARTILQRRSLAPLERRLAAATGTNAPPTPRRNALYDDLRAYLLLTTDSERLSSPAERTFLVEHLGRPLGAPRNPSAANIDADPFRSTVEAWVSAVLEGHETSFPGRTPLIDRVRALIYEPPSIDRVYRLLEEEGEARLAPLTLGDVLEGRDLDLFASRPAVPGLYTRRGYVSFVEDAIERETALPEDVDWVMGYRPDDIPRSMQSADTLASELHARYVRQYAAAWTRFVEMLRLRPFDSVRGAAHGLQTLGDVRASPLTRIFSTVSLETRLGVLTGNESATEAASAAKDALRRQSSTLRRSADALEERMDATGPGHPVDRRFGWLHAFGWEEASVQGPSPNVQSVLDAYAEAGRALEDISRSPDRAAEIAARVLEEGAESEFEHAIKLVRTSLPGFGRDVRHELFEQPIIGAWRQVVAATQRALNRQWRREVYRPFQDRLAGRYPLKLTSSREASIHDVEAFFHPVEGVVATFRTSALAPFLREGTLQSKTWQQVGLRLSNETRTALTAAERIGDQAFDGGVMRVEFQLRADHPESEAGAPAARQVVVQATGQTLQYDMGSYRPWTTFVWPGRPGAVLRIDTPQNELPSYTLSGAWAWFRLHDLARVERRTSTTSVLRWPMGPSVQAVLMLQTDRRTSPAIRGARFFRLECPAQLD